MKPLSSLCSNISFQYLKKFIWPIRRKALIVRDSPSSFLSSLGLHFLLNKVHTFQFKNHSPGWRSQSRPSLTVFQSSINVVELAPTGGLCSVSFAFFDTLSSFFKPGLKIPCLQISFANPSHVTLWVLVPLCLGHSPKPCLSLFSASMSAAVLLVSLLLGPSQEEHRLSLQGLLIVYGRAHSSLPLSFAACPIFNFH